MRVQFKLVLLLLVTFAAVSGLREPASASVAGLSLDAIDTSAHVSPLATPVYHHYPRRGRFCYSQHIQCELDAGGRGYLYRSCMRRRGCYPNHVGGHYPGDIYEYRRKGYSCRYWYGRCRDNWYYGEDIRGCLRYYGCPIYY